MHTIINLSCCIAGSHITEFYLACPAPSIVMTHKELVLVANISKLIHRPNGRLMHVIGDF